MKKLLFILLGIAVLGCADSSFKPAWIKEKAPETFTAKFETKREFTSKNKPFASLINY